MSKVIQPIPFTPRPAVVIPPTVVKDAPQLDHGQVNLVERKRYANTVAVTETEHKRRNFIVGGRGCLV